MVFHRITVRPTSALPAMWLLLLNVDSGFGMSHTITRRLYIAKGNMRMFFSIQILGSVYLLPSQGGCTLYRQHEEILGCGQSASWGLTPMTAWSAMQSSAQLLYLSSECPDVHESLVKEASS